MAGLLLAHLAPARPSLAGPSATQAMPFRHRQGASPKPRLLLLLSRPGCCLCDELEEDLVAEFGDQAFELERADVDSRPDWQERYGHSIPVLLDEAGRVLSEARLDAVRVASVLGV